MLNRDNKVIILVLAGGPESFQRMVNAVRETWALQPTPAQVLYIKGNSDGIDFNGQNTVQIGDVLHNNCKDGEFRDVLTQTLMSLEHVLSQYDFTHIFRCNSGSYVNIEQLISFISDKPNTGFYSGIAGECSGVRFASGSGFFLSRDLVRLLVCNKGKFRGVGHDDVEIGRFLRENGVSISPARRQDVSRRETVAGIDLSNYHYYIVHDDKHSSVDARDETRIPIMRAIHRVVSTAKREAEPHAIDIVGHIPYLTQVVADKECIIEIGSRFGDGSTAAFWRGIEEAKPRNRMWITVDLEDNIKPYLRPNTPCWKIVLGDSRSAETVAKARELLPDGMLADLIFIDTIHEYEHLRQELEVWKGIASRDCLWLFHDTWMYGGYNRMTDAIKEFAASDGRWRYQDLSTECHGLGALVR